MGLFDEERKRMGIQSSGNQIGSAQQSNGESIFAKERARQNGEESTYLIDVKPSVHMPEPTTIPKVTDIPMFQQLAKQPLPTTSYDPKPEQELKGRNLPVVGPILRALDATGDFVEYKTKIAPVMRSIFAIPGAGMANISGLSGAAESGAAKLLGAAERKLGTGTPLTGFKGAVETAPNLTNGLLKTGLQEAAVGAPLAAGQYLYEQGSSGKADLGEAAKQAAIGAGLGAAIGTAAPTIGKGIKSGLQTLKSGIQAAREPLQTTGAIKGADQMKGDWFTNLFGNQGVGISAFGSKRAGSNPVTTEGQIVNNAIKTDVQGVKDTVAAKARETYQNLVDRLSPLKRISNDTYETAMDATRANNIANTIVKDKLVTPEGTVVGEGLTNIFKKVARGQDSQFVDYLTLRHAKTRMERGENVYADKLEMTPEKVQARIDMYNQRHPEFADLAKEWDSFNENMLRTYGVDEGLIPVEMFNELRDKNPNYSPMMRQFSRSEKPGRSYLAKTTKSSFSGQRAPINEVSPTGSVRRIVDPRKTTIERVGAWTNAAMRNRTMQSMVGAIKTNPEAFKGIAEIVQKPKGKFDLADILRSDGEEGFLEILNGEFNNLFKKTSLDHDNIVRAMVKGEPVYIQVHDPEIVKTLIGMGPQASNVLIDVLSAFSNATKRGATGMLAPMFAVKGATIDLVQSAIQSKNPVRQATDTVHAIFSSIGDKFNIPGLKNLAEEYRRAGGEFSAALKGDRKLNTNISDMTRYPLLSGKNALKTAINVPRKALHALEAIGDIAENAPRMAAYKGELRSLGGERTPENVRQAMSQAREITTNFARKGALSRDLEAFVPYNNAAVQGTYRVLKGLKDNPVRTVAAIGTLAVLPKMYEYLQFHDDPEYQALPARERYRFLIVGKNQDGTFTKLPMEPAYNSIGEIVVDALRKYQDKDPNAFKGATDALANAWLPPAITGAAQGFTQGGGVEKSIAGAINSTVFAPAYAVASNQSFTGGPIESAKVTDRSPKYRYDEKTSWIAKKIGEITGYSPMKADYILRAYGGDPARLILPLTSDVGKGNVRNTLLKNFIVDPAFSNTLTDDFYTAKELLNNAYRDSQEVKAPLPKWYDDDLRKELTSTGKNSISTRVSELNDQKKALAVDKTITNEQRTEKIRDLQRRINEIYMDVNSKIMEKKVPIPKR